MPHIKSCGFLIFRGDPIDSFLLMKHPTRLDLPKGHVDEGETELECALRELWEETGISDSDIVREPEFRFTTQYEVRPKKFNYQPCEKTLVIFLGRLIRSVDIKLTEHEGFQWLPWNPPHQIQGETIDPLLQAVAEHISGG